ncbi:MAG: RNA polymerase sigma factor [Gammaproteobacteria bacterium]
MSGPFDQPVEGELVARARRGERSAQAALYGRFGGAVYTLARRLLLKPELAEDALQDTFVEVMRGLPKFRGEAPVGMWIRRVAVNCCLMQLRAPWQRYRAALPPEDDAAPVDGWDASDGRSWQDVLDAERALAELPPATRTVVWLHEVEGYTHDEIAELLHATPSFSKSQLARAYAHLREWATSGSGEKSCTQALSN